MGLDDFKDKNRNELSMIEVARAILEDSGKRMAFADIVNAVQKYLEKSDEEIRDRLPQFYTDMNTDGEFISMGDNIWALRSWFPYESVDEEVNHPEDEDEDSERRATRRLMPSLLLLLVAMTSSITITMIQKMRILKLKILMKTTSMTMMILMMTMKTTTLCQTASKVNYHNWAMMTMKMKTSNLLDFFSKNS